MTRRYRATRKRELAEAKSEQRNAQTNLALETISKIREKMSTRGRQLNSTEMIQVFLSPF